jgi:hypothetical protein
VTAREAVVDERRETSSPAPDVPPGAPPTGDVGDPTPPPDAAAPAEYDGANIPARFHGVYAAEGRCGSVGDETRLAVTGDRVSFHESTGRVTRARGVGDSLDVTLELTGEGQTRIADYRFRREEGGRHLVDAAGGMTRVRCEEKAGG